MWPSNVKPTKTKQNKQTNKNTYLHSTHAHAHT